MIKIEVLFPEVCNLFGDMFNIKFLEKSIKDVEVINTKLTEEPHFVKEDVDLIYLAPMTENTQELVIKKLMPYRDRILQLIDDGKLFLFTGNAFEILGQYIENEDGSKIEGLKISKLYAKRDMMHRYGGLYLGRLNTDNELIRILGFKASFSKSYGENNTDFAFDTIRGIGINDDDRYEGIRIKNCFGTYVLGPILVNNPKFAKYILKLLNCPEKLIYEDTAMNCYNKRLEEFENPKTKY